jgi:hypothetical protein
MEIYHDGVRWLGRSSEDDVVGTGLDEAGVPIDGFFGCLDIRPTLSI